MTFTKWFEQFGYAFNERELRERHGDRYDSYIEQMSLHYISSCVSKGVPVQMDI